MSCGWKGYCGVENCEKEKCPWGASIKGLMISSRLPEAKWNLTVLKPAEDDRTSFDRLRDIGNNIQEFVYKENGFKNLLICGNHTGNGKTSWAIKLLQKYIASIAETSYMDESPHAVFVPVAQFVHDAKAFNTPYTDRYYSLSEAADTAELVVYDDIGAARYTEYDYLNLLVSIERRNLAEKVSIFTTNFTQKKDLSKLVGTRLADRVWDSSEVIEIKGRSVRQ